MRWIWIDHIVDYEPERRMVAIKNVSRAEDHLHDHFGDDDGRPSQAVMPASLLIEGMAQTAGILVGTMERFRRKVILAKIVTARIERDARPGDSLRYTATLERFDNAGASTAGTVEHRPAGSAEWTPIGRIDLLFGHLGDMHIPNLPQENFVFSEQLRYILRDAGLGYLMD